MKLIINATGTRATGATQVTVSFIRECLNFPQHDYHLFLSPNVATQLKIDAYPDNFHFTIIDYKPFFNRKGIKTWRQLISLESKINPDCVFTIFGPSVWQPNAPHLMGYAYPYYVYPESPFFKIISNKLKYTIKLHQAFHKYYLRKNGRHFVCETQDVSNRLPNYLNCDPDKVYTVTNTYSDFFDNFTPAQNKILPQRADNELRFVTLSSFATHKNLRILNQVIPILRNKLNDKDIKFILTLNSHELENNFSDEAKGQMINLGRIKVEECPQVYHECDALFLPTLMECFSASYAEAMKMEKPIITSKLAFADAVCNDAALYFDPIDPEDIARKIILLATDKELQHKLVVKGKERLISFDTPRSRAEKYLKICEAIIRENDNKKV